MADAILVLRLVSELRYEFQHPLRLAYVDQKSVYTRQFIE